MIKKPCILLIVIACAAKESYAQCSLIINAESAIICQGTTDVLVASVANSYTWQPTTNILYTSITGDTIVVEPLNSTIYTATGTTGTCIATNTVAVEVNQCTTPIPVLSLSAHTICVGHCIIFGDSTQYTSTKPLHYTFIFQGAQAPNGQIYPPANSIISGDTLFYSLTNNTPLGNIKVCYNVNSTLNENDPAHNVYGYYAVTEIIQNGLDQTDSLIDSVMVTPTCPAGISQISNLNTQISIYPNPNNGSFVIEPNDATKQSVMVYDVTGKLVLSQTINPETSSGQAGKTNIDASSLNEGVYNISISGSEGVVNKRLVIVK